MCCVNSARKSSGERNFVVEVLSPHTAAKDMIQKRLAYERHGVHEYWTVHPTDKVVTIYRLGADGRFSPAEILEAKGPTKVDAIARLVISFSEIFPPSAPEEIREPPPLRYAASR